MIIKRRNIDINIVIIVDYQKSPIINQKIAILNKKNNNNKNNIIII